MTAIRYYTHEPSRHSRCSAVHKPLSGAGQRADGTLRNDTQRDGWLSRAALVRSLACSRPYSCTRRARPFALRSARLLSRCARALARAPSSMPSTMRSTMPSTIPSTALSPRSLLASPRPVSVREATCAACRRIISAHSECIERSRAKSERMSERMRHARAHERPYEQAQERVTMGERIERGRRDRAHLPTAPTSSSLPVKSGASAEPRQERRSQWGQSWFPLSIVGRRPTCKEKESASRVRSGLAACGAAASGPHRWSSCSHESVARSKLRRERRSR